MTEPNTGCPKCKGEMEEGFIIDHTNGATNPSDWIEGAPVKSLWSGTKVPARDQYSVKTFRCVSCGFLESYATERSSDGYKLFG